MGLWSDIRLDWDIAKTEVEIDETMKRLDRVCKENEKRAEEAEGLFILITTLVVLVLIVVGTFFGIRHHKGVVQYKLGLSYISGDEAVRDYGEGMSCLQKSSKYGNKNVPMQLALCYTNGTVGMKKDDAEALKWYTVAAKRNSRDAQLSLARCYQAGVGTEADATKAFKWYKKAAKHGKSDTQLTLARCYTNGIGTNVNDAMAFKWYKKAANKGNTEAQLAVADCYINGKGVDYNADAALRYYEKVIKQERNDVASSIESTNNAIQNAKAKAKEKIAIIKAQKEADKVQAMHEKEVVVPLIKVAKQGNLKAQLALAKTYANGDNGVRQNTKEALVWYEKAAKQGSSEAKEQIKVLKDTAKTAEQQKGVALVVSVKNWVCKVQNFIKEQVGRIKKDKSGDKKV